MRLGRAARGISDGEEFGGSYLGPYEGMALFRKGRCGDATIARGFFAQVAAVYVEWLLALLVIYGCACRRFADAHRF